MRHQKRNTSYKKRKNKRRTRKKKMKGAGRFQNNEFGTMEFVQTDSSDPKAPKIPIDQRQLSTMQQIYRETYGKELPPEIPDSSFYELYQAATERIGQEEAQESSSHGEPKYSGSSKSSLPATPLYSGVSDLLGEDISTPAKKNQKLIDRADKQTERLLMGIKQMTTGKKAAFPINLTGAQIIALFNKSSCTISKCNEFNKLIVDSLKAFKEELPVYIDWNDPNDGSGSLSIRLPGAEIAALNKSYGAMWDQQLQETIICDKQRVGLLLYNEDGYFCPLGIDMYENLVKGNYDLAASAPLMFIPEPRFHETIDQYGFINGFMNPRPDDCAIIWEDSLVISRSLIEFTREELSQEKEARLKQLEEAVKRPELRVVGAHLDAISPFITQQTETAEEIITTTVEDVGLGGKIPTSALVKVEEVSSRFVGDLASTNDNIHDVTGSRFPTGREAELVNVRTALAITQADQILMGLQEMKKKGNFLSNAPRGNNRDAVMAQRSLCQLIKQAGFCYRKTIEGTATDPAVKDMYKQTLMDKNCINTMLTVCPRIYYPDGSAEGVVLVPVYYPNGSTCDNVLNFIFRNKFDGRGSNWHQHVVSQAFMGVRDRLMATISRFPPGALFYGLVMSTKLAMNQQSGYFAAKSHLQSGITFNDGERIPLDMTQPPPEHFLIYDPRKNKLMDQMIKYLVRKRFYRNPTVFLKKLIKLAEQQQERQTQIYCSPIDYKSVGQNATLLHVASRDSLYFPLGVNGWSTVSPFTEKEWTSQELLGVPDLITRKLISGLGLFFSNSGIIQEIATDTARMKTSFDQLLREQKELNDTVAMLSARIQNYQMTVEQNEEFERINRDIYQINLQLKLFKAINAGSPQPFFEDSVFLTLHHNPFWEMILTSLKVPLKTPYVQTDYPFYDFQYIAPKNLITDQVSSNNNGVARTFDALNTCGIHEGEVCYASSNGEYLPTLQTARAADHAASQHQQNARHRINAAMITRTLFRRDPAHARLREGAIGNPFYALNLGFTILASLGFTNNNHTITVIQKRAKTSLSKERDPAFLFGESFYEMINATTCSSCEPCSTTTTTDLLHTCLPNLTGATVSKSKKNCKFICTGCSSTSPLLKWQVGAQNVTNKGSKTRAKTCFCDCYQEEYYNPVILQREQQKYQANRDQLCRRAVNPLNMVHDNISRPYNNDQALYNFIQATKHSWIKDGLPKKYSQFKSSLGVCTKKCGCQGKCLGNQMRARRALDAFGVIEQRIPATTFDVNPQSNWVSAYINAGTDEVEKQNHMTNVYCLVSILFEQMAIDKAQNIIIIKEPLNTMLQAVFGKKTRAAVTKILFNQLFWSHAHITRELAGQDIFFPTPDGPAQFAAIILQWQSALGAGFYNPTSQFLLLKFLLNSIVIGVPSVKNLTLYQTANVETVIGNIDINQNGVFYSTDNKAKSVEVDYKGTSAAEASGKFMDSLKNNPSAWKISDQSPTTLSIHVRNRHAAGKGKEIGDYGQQITAFAGEATCLSGDLNAFNRPGLAKRVSVTCRNKSLTSREMTDNIRERGDECFQLFSKPNGTNPHLSLIAIQVLQVAPVPQDSMGDALQQLQVAINAIENRKLQLNSIVKSGNVSLSEKKKNNF